MVPIGQLPSSVKTCINTSLVVQFNHLFLSVLYMIEQIIDFVGFNGFAILFLVSSIYLYVKNSYFTIYVIGFMFSGLINYILKGVFKQPRPIDDKHIFNLEKRFRSVMTFENYGMPSGHTQWVFYTTTFTYLALENDVLLVSSVFISLLTIYQRVQSKQHFLSQTIVGAIIGSILGFTFYKYAKNQLQGPLKPKAEEYAPL
jgi:membrane-associated phospholipid phosphatase